MNEVIKKIGENSLKEEYKTRKECEDIILDVLKTLNSTTRPIESLSDYVLHYCKTKKSK